MTAKRNRQMMRDGYKDFCPEATYYTSPKGLKLTGYDLSGYKEGWGKAENEYDSQLIREEELKQQENDDE